MVRFDSHGFSRSFGSRGCYGDEESDDTEKNKLFSVKYLCVYCGTK